MANPQEEADKLQIDALQKSLKINYENLGRLYDDFHNHNEAVTSLQQMIIKTREEISEIKQSINLAKT